MTDVDAITEDAVDPEWDPASARIEDVNRLLARRRRLLAEIREYERLERLELERLQAARERAIGSALRSVDWIDDELQAFVVAAWRRNRKLTRWATPNGIISSRKVSPKISVDDDQAARWVPTTGVRNEPMLEERREWKVYVKPLRAWLDAQVAAGTMRRIVIAGPVDDPTYTEIVDEEEGWVRDFRGDEHGHWVRTSVDSDTGEVVYGDLVDGVTWQPNGDHGCGRNFDIDSLELDEDTEVADAALVDDRAVEKAWSGT